MFELIQWCVTLDSKRCYSYITLVAVKIGEHSFNFSEIGTRKKAFKNN